MQVIHKKNFMPTVCCIYTALVLIKLVLEGVMGVEDRYYTLNLITMFCIVVIATFILSLHYYLQNLPLLVVIIGQYLILIGLIMGAIWVESQIDETSKSAYRDMFFSFTIPYAILAGAYYLEFFWQVKKAENMLSKIKDKKEKVDEN